MSAAVVDGGGPVDPGPPLAPATFIAPAIIDPVRSGGEPVIFFTPQDTRFVAAHLGYTHVTPLPGPEVLAPASGVKLSFPIDRRGRLVECRDVGARRGPAIDRGRGQRSGSRVQ